MKTIDATDVATIAATLGKWLDKTPAQVSEALDSDRATLAQYQASKDAMRYAGAAVDSTYRVKDLPEAAIPHRQLLGLPKQARPTSPDGAVVGLKQQTDWLVAILHDESHAVAVTATMVFLRFLDRDKGTTFVSAATIAQELGLSTSVVRRHLQTLTAHGWLTRLDNGTRRMATWPQEDV